MTVTARQLFKFICESAELIGDDIVCRASLWEELGRRGVPEGPARRVLRTRLVKELEGQGLIQRPHPRSRYLIVLEPPPELEQEMRTMSRRRFQEGMAFDAIEVVPPSYGADTGATARRRRKLRAYFDRSVMDGKDFICWSWDDCEASIGSGCAFTEGQLSHVGHHYDLNKSGVELRIVVVGQEVGGRGKARVTMAERSAVVHEGSGLSRRFESEPGYTRRNPHMLGTTLALRTILGLPGTDHQDEFLDIDGKSVHIFDCFALVNRLLCAAHLINDKTGQRTSTGKPTRTMLNNCERHFRATLEILSPTIVIIQGVKVWRWSQDVLVPVKARGRGLVHCDLSGRNVLVAPLTHPSAWGSDRWDSPKSPYFRQVVRPALRRAIKLTAG
jgi:hypothetical protein